jgi:2'-hydroxyisoflavone reductase
LLPIWQAPVDDQAGLLLVSPARAMKKGLGFRTLATTIRDTLEWQKSRPADKQVLRAGLTAEKEAELIAKLQAPKAS